MGALSGTDNNSRFVDCAIPCNNRGKFSIGLMFWLLARELLRMRGDPSCIRAVEWKESVDLFFYRDADEIKRQQDAKQAKLRREKEKAAGYGQQQQQDDGGYDQGNWDMPDTAIDDWGNDDGNMQQQQPMDDYAQEPQQQQQQYVDPQQQQYQQYE